MTEHTDLISRADAIEAVHEYYQKRFTEDSKWDADAKMLVLEDKTIAKDNMEICNIIKALPSTDAVKVAYICDGRKCDNECSECFRTLDIEHARDFKKMGGTYYQQESADTVPIEKYHELQHQFVMLGAAFADLTEVVRCKDCRHYEDGMIGY